MAGLITKHIFDLYQNKISRLQYSINKSFLGASGQDNYFGKVQVLYVDYIEDTKDKTMIVLKNKNRLIFNWKNIHRSAR